METIMTVEQLRKRASVLGIKNAKKHKKTELIVLISNAEEALKKKEEPKKEPKARKTRRLIEKPRGAQSRQIYDMLIEHPSWSHYKIHALIGCTYTNVRRVWLLYVKDKFVDERVKK